MAPSAPSGNSNAFRLAINGYGRIGRCFARAIFETGLTDRLKIVAINEPADITSIAHLTRFDSTHGRFPGKVAIDHDALILNEERIRVTHSATPEGVDWQDIDLVVECSGKFSARPDLQRFIDAGCPRLLLSNPGARAEDVDATIVPGVTHHTLKSTAKIVSAASCTTNAVVPVLSILSEAFSLEQVLLTTLHSAMNDQPLIDGYHHSDLARTRSAMQSIIPVTTGLARGVERLLPALAGRVEAKAIRVPTHNVSAIDMVLALKGDVCAKRINALLEEAAQGRWSRLIDWSDAPHASIDFNHDPHSAIVEGAQTRACGNGSANIFLWFDNEWGFANRMVELALHWLESFRAERG